MTEVAGHPHWRCRVSPLKSALARLSSCGEVGQAIDSVEYEIKGRDQKLLLHACTLTWTASALAALQAAGRSLLEVKFLL